MKEFFTKAIEAIKTTGFTKLAFAGLAALFAFFGAWNLFYAMLGIFVYVNANVFYKYIKGIKL